MENCDFMTGLGQFGDDVPPDKTSSANRNYPHWQISRNAQYFRFFILSYFPIALVKRALPELVTRRSRKSLEDCGRVTRHSSLEPVIIGLRSRRAAAIAILGTLCLPLVNWAIHVQRASTKMHSFIAWRRLSCGFSPQRHGCGLKVLDRSPPAKTDAFCHLRQLDHVVRQENEY